MNFQWIDDFLRWCVDLLPHGDTVECTHEGVKVTSSLLRKGVKIKRIHPGFFWHWPVTTRVYTISVVRQPYDLPIQSVSTRDGKAIMLSTSLVCKIVDPVKVLTKIEDVDDIVREFGAAAAADCIATREYSRLLREYSDGTIEEELLEQTKQCLRKYGVRVEEARVTDLCLHTPIRCEGSPAPFYHSEDEE